MYHMKIPLSLTECSFLIKHENWCKNITNVCGTVWIPQRKLKWTNISEPIYQYDPSTRQIFATIDRYCFQALRVEKSLQLPKQHSKLQPQTWKSYLTSIFLTIVTTLAWKYLFQNRLRFWRENDLASQTAKEKLHQETAKFAPWLSDIYAFHKSSLL